MIWICILLLLVLCIVWMWLRMQYAVVQVDCAYADSGTLSCADDGTLADPACVIGGLDENEYGG